MNRDTDTSSHFQYDPYIEVLLKAAALAGEEILKIYNEEDFAVRFKDDNSPLTRADSASHKIIQDILSEAFPDVPLLSEEGKTIPYDERKEWDRFFCIDPLDGTKEFIKRNGEFTVNIALIQNRKPVLGVIYVPVKDTLYIGGMDIGSYKINDFLVCYREIETLPSSHQKVLKLPVAKRKRLFTVVGSRSHMNDATDEFIEEMKRNYKNIHILTAGSSLKLCSIAEGSADVYPRFAPTMEWDTAAGQSIVEGSGGRVTAAENGCILSYNKKNLKNPWFIAAASDCKDFFHSIHK
jgi:3'(2'), 5'-bisphosphate nucleotidase